MFVGYFRGRIALVSTTRIVSMAGHDGSMMAQVTGELGGEEACNDALARDALGQMLCARRAEVEERLRACAAASAGQQVGGPEAGGGGDEEQAAGWAGVQSSIQLLLEAERVAIDSSLDAMGAREEAEEAL